MSALVGIGLLTNGCASESPGAIRSSVAASTDSPCFEGETPDSANGACLAATTVYFNQAPSAAMRDCCLNVVRGGDACNSERWARSVYDTCASRPSPGRRGGGGCTQGNTSPGTEFYNPAVAEVIRAEFGIYGDEAVRVATRESSPTVGSSDAEAGGTYSRNFLGCIGLFQFCSFGALLNYPQYADDGCAETQAHYAYLYFRDRGSDWSGWECNP